MSKFAKAYLGIGVVLGCIATQDAFKENPKLIESRTLVTETGEALTKIALEWPLILIDAVRNAYRKHKEEQTNESES